MVFVDTNVLLYAFAVDRDPLKSELAKAVITDGDIAFSVQVFQEFYFQATHCKRVDPLTSAEVEQVIDALSLYPVQENTLVLFRACPKCLFSKRALIEPWERKRA
jgi:predicted nucleic acid-binding protein